MPPYKFKCDLCKITWEFTQGLLDSHVSSCPSCKNVCENISFGGSGTLLKGRHMNRQLEGFPDKTVRLNTEADKEGDRMEKEHDAYIAEVTKGKDEK